jgi:prolyl 4-hydroxylase
MCHYFLVNVDQDVDEPWPLEVYGHDGKATNVTMAPGDMVLYESHSVIHGRPFPLKGSYYANVFVHFEPIGSLGRTTSSTGEVKEDPMYDPELDLPPYLVPGSVWEADWRSKNPTGWKGVSNVLLFLV